MSRSSAFISVVLSRRPARTLPWQAMVDSTLSRRSATTRLPSPSASSSARSRSRPLMLPWPSSAGTSRTMTAAGAKRLDHEAEPLELGSGGREPLGASGVELDHFGDQQHLPRQAAIGERLLQAFIDEPLMRRVLIDDDEGILRLGDDEGVVELRPRGAERIGERRCRRCLGVSVGARRGDWREGRLRTLRRSQRRAGDRTGMRS